MITLNERMYINSKMINSLRNASNQLLYVTHERKSTQKSKKTKVIHLDEKTKQATGPRTPIHLL